MPTPDSSSDRDPVEVLADEFVQRQRRGERPTLEEYAAAHPELAGDIRDLFPALVMMEEVRPSPLDLTGPPPAPDARLERLGDYRILREVGRGGMGVVYEAEQESLGRHVALKVLPPAALLNPTYLERFRREAKAAARLHHTNIVPVFGVGEAGGVPYYAMQFIHGEGLDRVLADVRRLRQPGAAPAEGSVAHSLLTGQFSAPVTDQPAAREPTTSGVTIGGPEAQYCRAVARIGVQVAEALAYAHRQGVLHRDIKPSNLLLDAQGTVWVTDFGLAKAEGADELTHTGDIVGTVRFMAPERFEGKSLPQSDVYALGLTLYEMLTLRPAFANTGKARLIDQVLSDAPVSPRKLDPRIPRDLETVVLKCLAKEPRERYAGAEQLAEDLRRFLADRPIQARRASWAERLWRWCRRNPALAGLSAAVLLLLLVVALGGAALSASRGAALAEARHKLFASYVSEARARRFSGRAGQRFGALEAVRKAAALAGELGMPASTFAELRELAVAALSLPDLRLEREVEGWPEGCDRFAFDAPLEHVARCDANGDVTVHRLADNRELARLPGGGVARHLSWGTPGPSLLVADHAGQALNRWNYQTGELTRLGSLPACSLHSVAVLTPDGRRQAWVQRDGVIDLTDYPSGQPVRRMRVGSWPRPRPEASCDCAFDAMHPFRNLLAVSFRRQAGAVVHVLDLDRGEAVAELRRPGEPETGHMSWLPDGRTLVVGYTGSVVFWDVPSRRQVHVLQEHRGGGLTAKANALGDVLTHSDWAGGAKLWQGQTGHLLLSMPGVNFGYATSGQRFIGNLRTGAPVQVWRLESARECRTLVRARFRGDAGDYWRCAIHPAGRLAAAGTTNGVTLLDLNTGTDVGHLDLGHNWNVTFDPATGDLVTYGQLGLFRWPVRTVCTDPRTVRLGPPRRLPLAGRGVSAVVRLSGDGKALAVAQGDHAVVLREGQLDRPVVLSPLEDVRSHLAMSPDGRWVATGRNDGHGGDVRVWDARSGALVKAFGIREGMNVAFSPDGHWLVANDKRQYRFYRAGTWDEGPQKPVQTPMFVDWPPAFSPGGGLLALERGDGAVRLIDPASGSDLAVLEDPQQGRAGEMTFSPDGTLLLLVNKDANVLRLWDLRRLREGLAALGLDWKAPAYGPCGEAGESAVWRRPLEVEIAGAEGLRKAGTE